MATLRRLVLYLVHLRLPFQLTLAPIFLWGALSSGGGWDAGTTAAFVALHLFLYPAATAFNSAYDRDEGPVSGIEHPREVPPGLAAYAIVWALPGFALAPVAGPGFAAAFAGAALWSFAYSHPRTRLKAGPWKSGAAIALGQGALGFAAGWLATAAPAAGPYVLLAGAAGAAFTALGLYPVTQVFQIDEDAFRGDRTIAVVLGAGRALRFGAFCLAAAAIATVWLVARLFGAPDAFLIALGYCGLILRIVRLSFDPEARYEPQCLYRPAMRLLNWATTGFLVFLALEAIGSG
jgi:1,4-dihydroxy-2-naphthoate octaprenyltransferase